MGPVVSGLGSLSKRKQKSTTFGRALPGPRHLSEPTWRGAEPDPPRTLRPQREDRDGERPDIPPKRAIFGSTRSENSIFTVFFRPGMLFSTPGYDHPIWSPHSPKFHQPRCTSVWVMLTWHRGGSMYLSSSEALGGCRVDPPNQYLTSWARVRPPPPTDPSNATPYWR